MTKTIHLSFEIEGAASSNELASQAARMVRYLYDNGLITDTLSEDNAVGLLECYVTEGWTTDWPTEPGYYWFYGWTHGYWLVDSPKIHLVNVVVTVTVPLYHTDRGFFDEDDGAKGYWMPARVPEPPEQLMGGHNG